MPRISREAHTSLRERLLRFYESLMVDANEFVKKIKATLKDDNNPNNDPDKKPRL